MSLLAEAGEGLERERAGGEDVSWGQAWGCQVNETLSQQLGSGPLHRPVQLCMYFCNVFIRQSGACPCTASATSWCPSCGSGW